MPRAKLTVTEGNADAREHGPGIPRVEVEASLNEAPLLMAEIRLLRRALGDLEWAEGGRCPDCGARAPVSAGMPGVHERDCGLAAALGRQRD